ncbi:MAG: hypothetical protein QM644_13085 [Mobilitalea sp.]
MKSCTLKERYIRQIASGRKTKEARMANPMFQRWQIGDMIRFFSKRNPSMFVVIKICRKTHYKTIREMLEAEGIDNLLDNVKDIEQGIRIYLSIPNYADLERQYGVLAFDFELVDYNI